MNSIRDSRRLEEIFSPGQKCRPQLNHSDNALVLWLWYICILYKYACDSRLAVVSVLLIRVPHRFHIRGASSAHKLPEATVRERCSHHRGKIMRAAKCNVCSNSRWWKSYRRDNATSARASAQQWRPLSITLGECQRLSSRCVICFAPS